MAIKYQMLLMDIRHDGPSLKKHVYNSYPLGSRQKKERKKKRTIKKDDKKSPLKRGGESNPSFLDIINRNFPQSCIEARQEELMNVSLT